ncbi:DEAD/DEAH box helicase [Pseudomonas oligotrophica]|uniref:DEAD/DEAH box helicase n=1 Tax=Pseudomonas oligotrophica TaxID=2912055 RepID=UPI001F2AEF15|nr:DEAD/DEAH box helicase [Pseudomonas oligotrophica]MCF7202259.1 DEAD/DEAH box helicase [Pseudomonas oligotrophica]
MPEPRAQRQVDDLLPTPRLSLGSHLAINYQPGSQRMVREYQHRAGLSFVYGAAVAHGKRDGERIRQPQGDEMLLIARQPQAEQQLRRQLEALGFRVALRQSQALPRDSAEMYQLPNEEAWLRFVREQLPELYRQGWQIDLRPGFLYDLTPVDGWYAEIQDGVRDGFDLDIGIIVDDQRIGLLPVLLKLIRQHGELLRPRQLQQRSDDEQLRVQLDQTRRSDGQPLQVLLPIARLRPILATLGELYFEDAIQGGRLHLSRIDGARLAGLKDARLDWQGGDELRELASRLQALRDSRLAAPRGLAARLRPYQLQGVAWLQALREARCGGILGDDMGLGKTLQSLAHLLIEKEAGRLDRPALVVMPTSLLPNWQDEAARFAPALKVLVLQGSGRRRYFDQLADYDLLLTSYALLPRDIERLREQPLHLLILDEAQNIKNASSKAAQAAGQLDTRQRLCLTGTPVENHLGELWSLFHFLMPGWLGDARAFSRDYRTPIEKHGDQERLAHLRARIAPFLLRRRKEDVASELPAKTEMTHWVELSEAQRETYEHLRLAMDRKVREEIARRGLASSQMIILEALLKLRQVCCDLRLVKSHPEASRRGSSSAKLDSLVEMLRELIAEGRRVLVFSQFTSMLALIEQALQQQGIAYLSLTGATRDRRTPVARFQRGEVPVFLISLKAGGTGLNLTAADTVIHYDPWWNPAAEAQATDRAYRIGQDKPVFVYRLISRGTVEERIGELQHRKAELAAGLLAGAGSEALELEPGDIEALFAPLR